MRGGCDTSHGKIVCQKQGVSGHGGEFLSANYAYLSASKGLHASFCQQIHHRYPLNRTSCDGPAHPYEVSFSKGMFLPLRFSFFRMSLQPSKEVAKKRDDDVYN